MSVVTGLPSSTVQTEEGIEVTSTATNIATKETSSVPVVTIPYASEQVGGIVKASSDIGKVSVSSRGEMSFNYLQSPITLDKDGWAGNIQTVYVDGIHPDGLVFATYTQESSQAVAQFEVRLQSLIEGGIVAVCNHTPTVDINLNIFVI